eukprot:gnl/TRDRNA2_/TRDRNA2_48350_c0_seq1.p1 gnl/TRDRNA2_/TRDRNA2_48350_c0~~gnl/TRDRNA2_/TRDRNA2_48350_c0_seq1.p1  ORF type:complete len:368 (-),score=27.45 gnl/TRDRNA2_/TRDRNA2_48350_c0_seq1:80-1183(-)
MSTSKNGVENEQNELDPPGGGIPPNLFGFDLAALALYSTFPLGSIALALVATLTTGILGGMRIRAGLAGYLAWAWLLDQAPCRGGYAACWRSGLTEFLRAGFWWRWAASYFPVKLYRSVPLPPEAGPYIFVCHPHGIIGISPMTNFGTDATDYSKLFPGLPVHLLGHSAIFRIPIFREWCLLHGHGSVDRKTCLALLREGHCIALAPGGAKESLECTPGTMRLFLQRRRGFVKLALQTGAALVPVIGFGENELYATVQFRQGSLCRRLQEILQACLGFALPLFCGRRWMPLLPKRLPVSTVVGAPVRLAAGPSDAAADGGCGPCELKPEPTVEAVAELHEKYCEALRSLFETHKAEHGLAATELQIM